MARRSNTVGKRFAKMRGLAPDEKIVMQRIARLMDAALNNRQPGNPYEPMHNKNNRVVYPVTGLTTQTGVKTIKLLWDAPPTSRHLRYSITITNKGTGETVVRSSFTNNYTFTGGAGDYKAVVASVGRNGTASPVKTIDFSIAGDTIAIEGNKLLPNEIGTIVQEDIFLLPGQKVFVWGSLVLDAYQGVISNDPVILKLYYKEGDNATFDNTDDLKPLQLIEQITLYSATESASCLDDFALGQEIHRPVFPRVGSFETAQSVMFSPISVAESEEDKRYTFFLQATNRELNGDEVGLSLVLWAGSEGQADSIPEDPNVTPLAYAFPHYNSFHQRIVDFSLVGSQFSGVYTKDARWWMAQLADNYNLVGNQWTFACWFRPATMNPKLQFSGLTPGGDDVTNPATNVLFKRRVYHPGTTTRLWNNIEINYKTLIRNISTGVPFPPGWGSLDENRYYHELSVTISSDQESGLITAPTTPNQIRTAVAALIYDGVSETYDPSLGTGLGLSSLFPWQPTYDNRNNGWMFLVVCFEGSLETDANSVPKVRMYLNNGRRDWDNSTTPFLGRREPLDIGLSNGHTLGMKRLDKLVELQGERYLMVFPLTAEQAATSTTQMAQNDRHSTVLSWGHTQTITHNTTGIYYGDLGGAYSEGDPPVYDQPQIAGDAHIHQAGFWNVALDNWNGNSYVGAGNGIEAIYYLYNTGRGAEIDWRQNSGPATELTTSNAAYLQGSPYIMADNLVHFWQFGQIEQAFSTGYPGRDTGFHLYHGDFNHTGEIRPLGATNAGASPNSYSYTTSIADVVSPDGENGTTQSDYAYPGQQLPDSVV